MHEKDLHINFFHDSNPIIVVLIIYKVWLLKAVANTSDIAKYTAMNNVIVSVAMFLGVYCRFMVLIRLCVYTLCGAGPDAMLSRDHWAISRFISVARPINRLHALYALFCN